MFFERRALEPIARTRQVSDSKFDRRIVALHNVIEAEQPATARVLENRIIGVEVYFHFFGDVLIFRVFARARLDRLYCFRNLTGFSVNRARRPVAFPHFIKHRPPNTNTRIGLEASALRHVVFLRRFQQADHARLH